MKKHRILWPLTIIAAFLLINGSYAAELTMADTDVANLGIEVSPPQIAEYGTAIEARARVVLPPNEEMMVTATHAGVLVRQRVAVGQEVSEGDVLAEIRSADFIATQRGYLEAAIERDLAQQQLARDQQLFDEGIISRRRLEETQASANTASTRLHEHHQLLRLAGLNDADIDSLLSARELQHALMVRAPISGVVLESHAVVGGHVEAVSGLYRLGNLSTLCLDIQVTDAALASVTPGMTVIVASPLGDIGGEILTVGRSVDPNTQTALARAVLVDANNALKPGQFVTVKISAGMASLSEQPVWRVPTSAIVRSGERSYVFVRSNTGFDTHEVQLIGSEHNYSYVGRGLPANAEVATTGVSALKALWISQAEAGT